MTRREAHNLASLSIIIRLNSVFAMGLGEHLLSTLFISDSILFIRIIVRGV